MFLVACGSCKLLAHFGYFRRNVLGRSNSVLCFAFSIYYVLSSKFTSRYTASSPYGRPDCRLTQNKPFCRYIYSTTLYTVSQKTHQL